MSIIAQVTEDVLHLYGYLSIFSEGQERLQYYDQFVRIYEQSSMASFDIDCGALSNYMEIAEFVTTLTLAREQPGTADEESKNAISTTPLESWSAEDWESTKSFLKTIQRRILRKDATWTVEELQQNGVSDEEDRDHATKKCFQDPFFKLMKFFKLHIALAPFRQILEERCAENMQKEAQFEPLVIPKDVLDSYRDLILEAEDESIRSTLKRLLTEDQSSFRSPHDISKLLNDPSQVFSYKKFLQRAGELLQLWVKTVLGKPLLYDFYFGDNAKDKLQRLKESRERLGDHVEDPLPEIAEIAARARREHHSALMDDSDDSDKTDDEHPRKRKGHMLDKKKSATRLGFDDNGNDDDEDEEVEDPDPPALRSPPPKRIFSPRTSPLKKQRKSQEKSYEGRRNWSDAEISALREGIAEYGLGKWALIKERYDTVLKDRTSGQIKDKYRNMKKKGELDDIPEAHPERESTEEASA